MVCVLPTEQADLKIAVAKKQKIFADKKSSVFLKKVMHLHLKGVYPVYRNEINNSLYVAHIGEIM